MALTRNFKDTVKTRVERDRAFKAALFREALDCLMSGDLDTGKTVLRDYINATIGFDRLAAATGTSPKSLMRMLGPKGNPQARNLVEVIAILQKKTKLTVRIKTAA
ncbi:MAG: transcriptional regulator [Rhodospirillales bacterium]|nr:transcriptional regulator [Rhodospirillales bacterium]MSP79803.1 transcriptional regulator [Rhodospirillales bacterium]